MSEQRDIRSGFLKGIHRRFPIGRADDPERLYTLENARLFKREETGYVSRIEGSQTFFNMNNLFVWDMAVFNDHLAVLYEQSHSPGELRLRVLNIQTGSAAGPISVFDKPAGFDYGKLIVLENTLLVSPLNKMINHIDGEFRVNDFVSTTPLLTTQDADDGAEGNKAEGHIEITQGADLLPVVAEEHASGEFHLTGNALSSGSETHVFRVDGSSNVTVEFNASDTDVDVLEKLDAALKAHAGISNDWDIDLIMADSRVRLTAKQAGTDWNDRGFVHEPIDPPTNPQITFNATDSSGGVDAQSENDSYGHGIVVNFSPHITETADIFGGESPSSIAEKVKQSIENLAAGGDYTLTRTGSRVDIVAKQVGPQFNRSMGIDEQGTGAQTDIENISGGTDPFVFGNLDPDTGYWYRVRYVFSDGHKTRTCFPQFHRTTGLSRAIRLNIEVENDLDGQFAHIEIFRRRGSESFFMIERLRPSQEQVNGGVFTYVDQGRPDLDAFGEQDYVWTERFRSHCVVRDRLVRAGVDYADKTIDPSPLSTDLVVTGQDRTVPNNIDLEIFARPRFEDGTEGFHHLVGQQTTDGEQTDRAVRINQNAVVQTDQPIKEMAYFARFQPKTSQFNFPFNSIEIFNQHVPSIATSGQNQTDQNLPIQSHVFLGWKYLLAAKLHDGQSFHLQWRIYDQEHHSNPDSRGFFNNAFVIQSPTHLTDPFPDTVLVEIINGQPLLYKKKFYYKHADNTPEENETVIYELAISESLKEAVRTQNVKLRLTDVSELVSGLSTREPLNRFFETVEDIASVVDQSADSQVVFFGSVAKTDDVLVPPVNSKIYLVLPSDSLYNEIDSFGINPDQLGSLFSGNKPERFIFRLLGVRQHDYEQSSVVQRNLGGKQFDEHVIEFGLVSDSIGRQQDNPLVYLGTKPNESGSKTFDSTGFVKTRRNHFTFWQREPFAIFSELIDEQSLESLQHSFPNQLVWSEPFVIGAQASGNRTFRFINFLNISRDHGRLLDIRYIGHRLLAFCERGVAVVNVGETLTQQPSGQVAVESARFLTGEQWILRSVADIKDRSIAEYEHMLFFCDGEDVWVYDGQLRNVSNGAVPISEGALYVGGIDPKHKEYRLSVDDKTWAYGIESQQWYGPYSYSNSAVVNYRDRMFGAFAHSIDEHNKGNTMGGQSYDTRIESVANDLGDPQVDKLFRRLYFDVGGEITEQSDIEVSYDTIYDNEPVVRQLFDGHGRRDRYRLGIRPDKQNAVRLFWSIKTRVVGFVLKMAGFTYTPRLRR